MSMDWLHHGHLPEVEGVRVGKQAFKSFYEEPEKCQAHKGTCRQRAVGIVIFGSLAYAYGQVIGVPMPVCTKHYDKLKRVWQLEEDQGMDPTRPRMITNIYHFRKDE